MEKGKQTYKLPEGWILDDLGNIAFVNMGQSPPSSSYNYSQIGLPFYQGKSEFGDIYPVVEKYCSEPIKIVDSDHVLISVRAPIGPTNLVKYKSCIGRGLAGIKAFGGMSGKFLLYQLRTLEKELQEKGTGTTFKSISKSILEHTTFKIPPLQEQQRIVSKIETLFSELEQAEKGLKKSKQQLEVYKQVLLKTAFEGSLTENWRKENNHESTEKLLERIKKERHRRYKQELEEWKDFVIQWEKRGKIGKRPVKPKMTKHSSEINKADYLDFINISPLWSLTKLSNITYYITDGDHQAPPKAESGIPFVTISNIKNNKIDFTNTFYVDDLYYNSLLEYRKPQKGDVLYTVTGSYGIPVCVDFQKKFCFQRHIGLLRPASLINSYWLFYLMQTKQVFNQANNAATGTAQKTVGLGSIRDFIIPVCCEEEQSQIVQKLDSQFSIIESLGQIIETSLNQSEVLVQSILKNAFEGKLVEQVQTDEPSIELINRITKEKEMFLKEQNEFKMKAPKKIRKMSKSLSIEEVLKTSDKPILAKTVWQESKHNEHIEDFYAELKELGDRVVEVKEGLNSLLSFKK